MGVKKTYQTFIFDLDDTLLNFKSAEKQALQAIFNDFKLELDHNAQQAFSKFNESLWKKLEKKQITRADLFEQRFQTFFKNYYHLEVDGNQCSDQYLSYLANGHEEITGARHLLTNLASANKQILLATNGVARVQSQRVKDAQFTDFFDRVFVSEEVGVEKPDAEFFKYLFAHSKAIPENSVIIGDSLSSDILGGNNAGIDTLWFNPLNHQNHSQIKPTYQISSLNEICKFS